MPCAPNSSFATSQGSRLSGAGTRIGALPGSAARCWILRASAYSGLRARHCACVLLRCFVRHASAPHVRCRSPTRRSGQNQRRQIEQGRFRGMPERRPRRPAPCTSARPRGEEPRLRFARPLPHQLRARAPRAPTSSSRARSSCAKPSTAIAWLWSSRRCRAGDARAIASPTRDPRPVHFSRAAPGHSWRAAKAIG